jgi:MarR family transcriptional regulator, organic hydroperoxide resistance regulator
MMNRETTKKEAIAKIMQFLRQIFKALQQYSEEVLRAFGVTGPQLWALKAIYREGPLSMGELSGKMYLHVSTVSGIVDRLEKKSFVERERDRADRRVVTIRLTREGKRLAQRTPEAAQGKLLHGLEALPRRQVLLICSALEKAVKLTELKDMDATFFFSEE